MKISENGILHLKQHESLRLKAYDDKQPNKNITSASQILGTLTIGWGHTSTAKVGMVITESQAVELLKKDLIYFENIVSKKIKVDINQNQFDSLVSFVYNVGEGNFGKSTLLKLLNQKDYQGAADQFLQWKTPSGIIGRRHKEKALFMQDFGVLASINPSAKNITGQVAGLILGAILLG